MRSEVPIFVMGAPRSGTTVTCWLIGQHPAYRHLWFETWIFSYGLDELLRSPTCMWSLHNFEKRFWGEVYYRTAPGYDGCGVSNYCEESKAKAALEFLKRRVIGGEPMKDAVRQFVDTLFMDDKQPSFVEKTPNHALVCDSIRRVYPDAVFVVPIRNKEDVVESLGERPWAPSKDERQLLSYVDSYYSALIELGEGDAKINRTIFFDMKQMCDSPEVLIEQLIRLGIPEAGMDTVRSAHSSQVRKSTLMKRRDERAKRTTVNL